jgi:hypothetical protein
MSYIIPSMDENTAYTKASFRVITRSGWGLSLA